MPEPRVTVLMPTWNAGELITPAVESVLSQTVEDWRLLVVDDGSSDGTPEAVESYGDPRVDVVRQPENAGQTAALNRGIGLVRTCWIARLDQDDVAAPDRLEAQLGYVKDNANTTALGSWADFIDEQGNVLGRFRPATDPAGVRRELYARSLPIAHSAALYRTEAVRSAGGYQTDLRYAQDFALWARLARLGDLANVGRVLVYLRKHSGQTSGDPGVWVRQIQEQLQIMDSLPEELALDAAERRAWAARRLRLTSQLSFAAALARQPALAIQQARETAGTVAGDPAVLNLLSRSGIRHVRRQGGDMVGRTWGGRVRKSGRYRGVP